MRPADDAPPHARRKHWLGVLLPLLVLAAGAGLAYWLLITPPGAEPVRAQPPKPRLVATTPARAAPATFLIRANGTVEAANSTELRARVSGQIVALDERLAPGTRFAQGETLVKLDPSDYELALERARTDLANAKAKLATEKGQQAVAKRELAQVGVENVNPEERNLALRGPQLAQAKAAVRSAHSSLQQARHELSRTKVRAPYAGIVVSRSASVGDVISTGTTIATLAATDAYWVDVPLPVDQLRWLHAGAGDRPGSPARIYYPQAWGPDKYLTAHVLRVQAALEEQGRMARVLLQVPNPLGQEAPDTTGLLLGAYVDARIQVRLPDNAVVIDSAYLRENSHVWVMTTADTLAIKKVDVAYQDNNRAILTSGLAPGARVVTTDLAAPIAGRSLRTHASHDASREARASDQPDKARPAATRVDPSREPAPAADGGSRAGAAAGRAPTLKLSPPAGLARTAANTPS